MSKHEYIHTDRQTVSQTETYKFYYNDVEAYIYVPNNLCKMRCSLNLVLENLKYLWFY